MMSERSENSFSCCKSEDLWTARVLMRSLLCSSRWSFCVKGVLMSTEVRGHLHYTTLLVLDVRK